MFKASKITTRGLTWPFVFRLDRHDTLTAAERGSIAQTLTLAFGRSLLLRLSVVLIIIQMLTNIMLADANAYKDHHMNLKLYAHNQIKDWDEFICYIDLIYYENRGWDRTAKNGSHYGIGQMRSTWYKDLSARKQIKAHLRYLDHRYSSICSALKHFERKGWH